MIDVRSEEVAPPAGGATNVEEERQRTAAGPIAAPAVRSEFAGLF
jgi:hypothetical protein